MKNKEEIKKLAQEIAQLELIIENGACKDRAVQSTIDKIKIITESLSLKQSLELNDAVLELLEK